LPLSLQEVLNPSIDNIETKKTNFRIIENILFLPKIPMNILPNIGQQLLDNKHTLTMGEILQLVPNLKQYVLACLNRLPKPNHLLKPKIIVVLVAINLHMAIILVHLGKNLVEDVLFEGGSKINVIFEDLHKKLDLPLTSSEWYIILLPNM